MYRLDEDYGFLDTDTHLIVDLTFLGVFVLGILVEFANTMWILVAKLNEGIKGIIVWIRERKKSKVSDIGLVSTLERAPNQETPSIARLNIPLGDPSPISSDLRGLGYEKTPTMKKKKTGLPQIESFDFHTGSDRDTRVGSIRTVAPESIGKLLGSPRNTIPVENRLDDIGNM